MASKRPWLPLSLIAALLIAGCSSGASGAEGEAPAATTAESNAYASALADLTLDDLPALVLQQDDYGLLSLGMEISDESGPQDNEDASEEFETIEVSVATIEELGRLGGYRLGFEDPSFETNRIVQVDTWIDLFESADDIDAYLELGLDDIRATDGVGGFELVELVEVDIPLIENASGWSGLMGYPGFDEPLHWSFGFVRHGRLVAGATVYELGDGDRTAEMIGVLQQLDTRLRGALDGSIEVSVEHVLPATDEDREVPAPIGGPDLAAMALTPEDLGPGWQLDDDGYYADPDRLAVFNRTFKYTEQGAATIGTSEVVSIETELQLWPSVERASSFITSRRSLFEGEEGAATYARIVAEDGGPIITNVTTEFLDLQLGDQATIITITADWGSLGRQANVFIAIRHGDVISWTTVHVNGVLSQADLEAIAGLSAARLTETTA